MKVLFKKLHPEAQIPKYTREGDAAKDVVAVSHSVDEFGNHVYGLGFAVEIPSGYCMKILPRSSNSKMDLYLTNSEGLIDSNYRGEILLKFRPTKELPRVYTIGDRIGQIQLEKVIEFDFIETDTLSNTTRGSGGFGSSGR